MTTQIRDTSFGRLVRLLSRDTLFQYPDELQTPEISFWDQYSTEDDKAKKVGKDSLIVGWYGPDDPEVRCIFIALVATRSHTRVRILTIGQAAGNCWSHSKCAS
jgi:hypothetical protein